MHQTRVPKKGRDPRDRGKKTTVALKSEGGMDGTKAARGTTRLCKDPHDSLTFAQGELIEWNSTRRTQKESFMYKTDAATRCPQDPINHPPAPKEKRPALPVIKKGAVRDSVVRNRNSSKSTDFPPTMKTPQKAEKFRSQPVLGNDMTPWVRTSPSESSLTALLRSIPSPRTCSDNMADRPPSQREMQNAVRKDSWVLQAPPPSQPPILKEKTGGRTKHKGGRAGITKRRTLNKFHCVKLPPVPAVTELSFSRNFSFSFYELPQYQSPQHWLQRQRSVHMLMRQLH